MISRVRISDSEPDRDTIEEADLRRDIAIRREVIADIKNYFILAHTNFVGRQQRLIGPSIGIRSDAFQELAFVRVQRPEFDLHALGGTAVSCIEDVSAEPCGHESKQRERPNPTFHLPFSIPYRLRRAAA